MIISLFFDLIIMSKQENWWEFNCHILTLINNILVKFGSYNTNDYDSNTDKISILVQTACDTVNTILIKQNPTVNTLIWGVVALASAVSCVNNTTVLCMTSLYSTYSNALLSLPSDIRTKLLIISTNEQSSYSINNLIPLPSSNGIPFFIKPLPLLWQQYSINIVNSIITQIVTSSTDSITDSTVSNTNNTGRLTSGQFELIYACINRSVTLKMQTNNYNNNSHENIALVGILDNEWIVAYKKLSDYIIIGLSDYESALNASNILLHYISYSSLFNEILQNPKILAVMRLLYPITGTFAPDHPTSICQMIFETMLTKVHSLGSLNNYNLMTITLLNTFNSHCSQQFMRSNLTKLLRNFQ